MSTETPAADADHASGSSPLGFLTRAQTYKNALYLLLRFPLGIVYFVVFVTLTSAGVALIPVVVGLAILALVLPAATYLGYVEATLAELLLDRDIAYSAPNPNEEPLVPYLKRVHADTGSYLLLGYGLLTFPVGIALFTLLVGLGSVSAAAVVAPFVYNLSGVDYTVANLGPFGPLTVDTLPEAILVSLAGLFVAIATLYLCNVLARAHAALTERVLAGNS